MGFGFNPGMETVVGALDSRCTTAAHLLCGKLPMSCAVLIGFNGVVKPMEESNGAPCLASCT
jgi:hypothetical protein